MASIIADTACRVEWFSHADARDRRCPGAGPAGGSPARAGGGTGATR